MSSIPYGRQDINQADIDAVVMVLRSNLLTQGPAVPAFEKILADYCGAQHCVAVNSATSALHIACLALGVESGDIVWTAAITFVASANCALYCGAKIDFVDIDPLTYNMSIEGLSEKLEEASKSNKLPKVLIPVHLCGQSCDMKSIRDLSQKYGFKIIEDASHAIGGRYKNEPIGSCRYSDITIFSFHPVKIITTGEGGAALTNDPQIANRLRILRSHGITNESDKMQPQSNHEIWNYQQIDLGFNYRMTDLQAALGLSQMQRLDQFVSARNALAERYDKFFVDMPIQKPWQHPDSYSARHLYVIRLKLHEMHKTQQEFYNALHADGILVNLHYIPVYRQPYYRKFHFNAGYCPQAEEYYSEAITIPLYSGLTHADQDRVMGAISEIASL